MVRKTTIYLPDDLKIAVEREARRRSIPEAEVIRQAIAAGVARHQARFGFLDEDPIAERVDELLRGFGER